MPPQKPAPNRSPLTNLALKGKLSSKYALAEGPDGLIVIDLKAAHQRILFERLLAAMNAKTVPSQPLLLPVPLNLTLDEARFLRTQIQHFEKLGFSVEPFSGNSFIVTAVPSGYPDGDLAIAMRDILDDLRHSNITNRQSAIHLAQVACRHAASSKTEFTELEIHTILHDLAHTTMPYTCPNGHPTMVHITFSELEKRFRL